MKYTKEVLEPIVKQSFSIYEVLRRLNLRITGGNHSNIKNRIKDAKLNTSHFLGMASNKGKEPVIKITNFEKAKEKIFIKNKQLSTSNLKKYISRFHLLENECSICKNKGVWNNKSLLLEIDHLNGKHEDNRIENLRYICPNCHSQLETSNRKKA